MKVFEYGNSDPHMADDLEGSAQGLEDLLDKGKRAADIMRKGSDYLRSSGGSRAGSGAGAGGSTGAAAGSAAAGSGSGIAGGTATGAAGGGTAAASATTGEAAAGGAAAGSTGAAGGGAAAAGGAGGVAGALPVIGIILIILLIIGALTLLPEAVWNPITHVNDGEGMNRLGTTNVQELSYENTFEDEEQAIFDEADKAEEIVSNIFSTALTKTKDSLSSTAIASGWIIDWEGSDVPDGTDYDVQSLYTYCAYSASVNNLLGERESLFLDTDGEVQQRESFFNQDGNAAMEDMKRKLQALYIQPHPTHTYGNYIYGAEMGEPYEVEEEGIILTYVKVKVFDVDTPSVSAQAFSFDLDGPYEDGMSECTYGDIINEMVGIAGTVIYGDTFTWAGGGYGYGFDLGFRAYRAANAGTENDDIVEVATQVVGYSYGEPYWSWYGWDYRVEWCAVFVSWVANECGFISDGTIPRFSSCSDGMGHFQRNNQYQSADSDYTPKAGDIVFFDWEGDGLPNHVGIVTSATDGGSIVYTVEGNTSNPRDGREGVWQKTRYRSSILGYGIPLYPGSEVAA